MTRDTEIAWMCRGSSFAMSVANSDRVMAVYAAPEFEELNGDGQTWIAAIVEEAISRLTHRADHEHVQRVCEAAKADILVGDDGRFLFWPNNGGAFSARDLRVIADELDRGNAAWEDQLATALNTKDPSHGY